MIKPNLKPIQLGQPRDTSVQGIPNQRSHPYGLIVNGRRYYRPSLYQQTGNS